MVILLLKVWIHNGVFNVDENKLFLKWWVDCLTFQNYPFGLHPIQVWEFCFGENVWPEMKLWNENIVLCLSYKIRKLPHQTKFIIKFKPWQKFYLLKSGCVYVHWNFRCDIPVVFYKLNTKYNYQSKQQKLLYYVLQLHVSALFFRPSSGCIH